MLLIVKHVPTLTDLFCSALNFLILPSFLKTSTLAGLRLSSFIPPNTLSRSENQLVAVLVVVAIVAVTACCLRYSCHCHCCVLLNWDSWKSSHAQCVTGGLLSYTPQDTGAGTGCCWILPRGINVPKILMRHKSKTRHMRRGWDYLIKPIINWGLQNRRNAVKVSLCNILSHW